MGLVLLQGFCRVQVQIMLRVAEQDGVQVGE